MNAAPREPGGVARFEARYCLQTSTGETRWIEDSGICFADAKGALSQAQGVVRVVTERHLREQLLADLTAIDPLSGEMNRRRLAEELDIALEEATATGSSVAFLLVAIDGLAAINQRYGYDVADEIIAAVARRLRSHKRRADSIGRFAGNKFGLVLRNCNSETLAIAAMRFVNAVRETPLDISVGPIAVSVSAGGAVGPRHGRDRAELMAHAQEALDQARQAGRGGFRVFAPSLEAEERRRENLRLTDMIVAALHDRRIELAYQPVARTATRATEFHECLVRIRDTDGREIDASTIVAVAEKLDLVRLIDNRVLELAAADLRARPDLVLSVNVSASSVHDPAWMDLFRAEFGGGLASRLIIEITESAAIRDVEMTRRFVDRVRGFGSRVAIDDFGAGHTSFRNLRRLGVDFVKIDGSFVANLDRSSDDRLFVRTLLELASELGLKTVAEWVQTESAAQTLAAWGCDYLQGALIGLARTRPHPEASVVETLRARG